MILQSEIESESWFYKVNSRVADGSGGDLWMWPSPFSHVDVTVRGSILGTGARTAECGAQQEPPAGNLCFPTVLGGSSFGKYSLVY